MPDASVQLVCREWRELERRVEEWDRLASDACEPNPFMESWFLLPALRGLAQGHVKILCLEDGGRLRGLLPIQTRHRYYRWPFPNISNWQHANCFLGVPLVATGSEPAFWRCVLDWADANAGPALFLHLTTMTVGGPVHAALDGVIAGDGRRAELVLHEDRAMLQSDLSPEQYWDAAISAKKRKELRRQAKRLSEVGELAFTRESGTEGLDRWSDDFIRLEAAGWKGQAGSALAAEQSTTDLFRQSLAGAAERGKLERVTLTLDGRPIAMLANFLAPPGAFSFKTAFDETFARYSPGVLLQRENLAMLERPDIAWTDSCASADHPMIDHIWRERRAVGHLSVAIGGKIRRAIFERLVDAEIARNPQGIQP